MSTVKPVSNAVVLLKLERYCSDKSVGKPICTARAVRRGRYKDVSNEHLLVIQKILSHLNTKNDEVVVSTPPQSIAPPQISLFE
jgi:hypothetical protein